MQPLKHHEDAVRILPVHSDSVVAHAEDVLLAAALGGDVDNWGCVAMELDGIADEILKSTARCDSSANTVGMWPSVTSA